MDQTEVRQVISITDEASKPLLAIASAAKEAEEAMSRFLVRAMKIEAIDRALNKTGENFKSLDEGVNTLLSSTSMISSAMRAVKLEETAEQAQKLEKELKDVEGGFNAATHSAKAFSNPAIFSKAREFIDGVTQTMMGVYLPNLISRGFHSMVGPVIEVQKAIGELASLGVEDLEAIDRSATKFTNNWAGTSMAQFISASYDVKSALAHMSDEAVGDFTAMAALTAKATKATTDEMVGAFTTGYGILKSLRQDLTDSQFGEALAGGMATTVANFKTSGKQMADGLKSIGASASAVLVPMEEQLAILGRLQTTMSGSEAGVKYRAFVTKAAIAGNKLGLDFVDKETGKLRGLHDILSLLQQKFPDLSQAAAQVQLKEAFGSDQAVSFILQMAAGFENLQDDIAGVKAGIDGGSKSARQMAEAMNNVVGAKLEILGQRAYNLAERIGSMFLPLILPAIDKLSAFVDKLSNDVVPFLDRQLPKIAAIGGAIMLVVAATNAQAIAMSLVAAKTAIATVAQKAFLTVASMNPYVAILGTIAMIAGALWILYDENEEVHTAMVMTWDNAVTNLSKLFSYLADSFAVAFEAVLYSITAAVTWISEKINGALEFVGVDARIDTSSLIQTRDKLEKDFDLELDHFGVTADYFEEERKRRQDEKRDEIRKRFEERKSNAEVIDSLEKQDMTERDQQILEDSISSALGRSTVKIDQDSLDFMKNLASFEVINRFVTMTPSINASFGDVRETVDVQKIFDELGHQAQKMMSSSLSW